MKKNVIGLVAILVISFVMGKYFFKSQIEVEYLSENSNPEYQSDLKIIGEKVYFEDFQSIIGEGKYIEGNKYVFIGLDEDGAISKFVLSFDNYSVSKEKVNGKISLDSDIIIVDENDFIVIGDEVVRYDEGNKEVISQNISIEGRRLYKVSENYGKLVYYNKSKDSLYTYHVGKKILKRITYNVTENELLNFDDDFNLSDDGGYLYIKEVKDEKSMSVLGSDSSKIYGDHIIAENPIWVRNTEKTAYLYPYGALDDKENYKIGLFNIPKRKIDYINYSDKELVYPYIWSSHDDDIIYCVGDKNGENFIVNKIIRYDMDDKEKTEYERNYYLNPSTESMLIDKKDGRIVVVYLTEDGGYNCDFINTETGSEMKIENILPISEKKYLAVSEGFIVNADNAISYYNGDSTKVIHRITGSVDSVSLSGDNLSICEKVGEGAQIVFLKIK